MDRTGIVYKLDEGLGIFETCYIIRNTSPIQQVSCLPETMTFILISLKVRSKVFPNLDCFCQYHHAQVLLKSRNKTTHVCTFADVCQYLHNSNTYRYTLFILVGNSSED